jgi:23S rRNA (cytosine1962-C5)-methyltransferase
VELINDALTVLTDKGIIYFSTNFSKFVMENELIHATEIKDITKATTPFDFEGKLKRWCYRIVK